MRDLVFTLLYLCARLAHGQDFTDDGARIYDAALQSYTAGDKDGAAESYRQCYARALTPAAHAVCANGLGIALFKLGRPEEAAISLRRAFDTWPSVHGAANETARAALWLVEAERSLGHFAGVEPVLRSALTGSPSEELQAELHIRLAVILKETDHPEDARNELSFVPAMPHATPAQRIQALIESGELDLRRMEFDRAIGSFNRALSLAYEQEARGAQSDALQGLGMAWMRSGELSRAEPALKRSAALADSPPQRGKALQYLAALSARQEKYALAEAQLQEALASLRQALREEHPQIAAAKGDLADVYRVQNKLPEARRLVDEAWSAMSASLGPQSVPAAELLGVKARIEAQAKDLRAASESYAAAIETMHLQGTGQDYRLACLMEGYASVLASLHRGAEAARVRTELQSLLPGKR